MVHASSRFSVEERVVQGETMWVAIRARGADWSWLTAAEAAQLGRLWVEKYGSTPSDQSEAQPPLLAAAE
jgi:hypothetical protein